MATDKGEKAPFRPRFPWIGGDLQTLRDFLTASDRRHVGQSATVLRFAMPDGTGDRLSGVLERPMAPRDGRPLAVLIHGLTGCAESLYLCRTAGRLLQAGYPVLRLNLRGAGSARPLCREQYHSGRSEDLRAVLELLPADATGEGLVLVGWSLGGNMLLKGLAEFGAEMPIRAAAAISAPIDLAAAAGRLAAPRNALYQRWLLARMKREAVGGPEPLTPQEGRQLAAVRTVAGYDDAFTAPRNGFADAADYYARCSAARFMPAIPVPTLVVYACDDPWIPPVAYRNFDWDGNPRLVPMLTPAGGHVGFHAVDGRVWSDDRLLAFLERTVGST